MAAERLGVPHINVGQVLRNLATYRAGEAARMASGLPCEDDHVALLVKQELERVASGRGFLLDGFPRNLCQFALFAMTSFAVGCSYVLLDIDPTQVRARFLQRMNCRDCRRADYSRKSTSDRRCPRCGGPLICRPDNTIQSLEAKLAAFYLYESPLIQALDEQGLLRRLSACGNPEHDLGAVIELLESIH
jgi:adenylate kinase